MTAPATSGDVTRTVLVDMDGVLVDWTKGFLRSLDDACLRLGVEPWLTDLGTWSRWAGDDPAREQAVSLAFADPELYPGLEMLPGADEGLAALVEAGLDVRICSTPSNDNLGCIPGKMDTLTRYFGEVLPDVLDRAVFTHDKTLVRGAVLVDDKPEITGAMRPEWTQVVFDQPYNRHVDLLPRMGGWHEVGTVLEQLR